MIFGFPEIEILPFEGQGISQPTPEKKSVNTHQLKKSNTTLVLERKQVSRPSGALNTVNVGIKNTLNPVQQKKAQNEFDAISQLKEDFTFEELEQVWKKYCLQLKRDRKDSLHSTLTSSPMTMSSDYVINLDLSNTVQENELEREKAPLLQFLRTELKNATIQLSTKLIETERVQILDSKATFDKLAAENPSLDKFRKLFNLDVEM
jgi:hypothetical protein